MRLRTIEFDGVRGMPTGSWDFPSLGNAAADLVVVSGGSGSGKTTFLESVVAAKEKASPYGVPDSRWGWLVPKGASAAKVRLVWEASSAEAEQHRLPDVYFETESILGEAGASLPNVPAAVKQLLGVWSTDAEVGRIAYIHQSRSLPPALPTETATSGAAYRMTSSDAKFSFIHGVFGDPRVRARAGELFRALAPRLDLGARSTYRGALEPWFSIPSESTIIPYCMLSAAEKQAVLFSFMFNHPPLAQSIILIDAPEEGLGDVAAARLVRTLLGASRNTQFIVATASPHVAALAAPGRLVNVGQRDRAEAPGA